MTPTVHSFISPPSQAGVSSLNLFLHNFYNLGRTTALQSCLNPSPGALKGLVQQAWAQAHTLSSGKVESSSTLENAKENTLKKFEFHSGISKMYESAIKATSTFEDLRNLAEKSFSEIEKTITPDLYNHLKKPLTTPLTAMQLGAFFRCVSAKCQESESSCEEIQRFIESHAVFIKIISNPSLKEKYKELLEQTDKDKLSEMVSVLIKDKEDDLKILNPTELDKINTCLKKTWEELNPREFESTEDAVHSLRERLAPLNFPFIMELYSKDLSLVKVKNISKRLESYLVDLFTIKMPPSLRHIAEGQTAYPKFVELKRGGIFQKAFLKHLNSEEEMQHHQIYSLFLSQLPPPSEDPLFTLKTPSSHMLSQSPSVDTREDQLSYTRDLTSFMISASTPRAFRKIEEEQKFQTFIETSPLGFFDYISGSSLGSFLNSSYNTLSESAQESLFTQLGAICFLDLVLGNQDRLIPLDVASPDLENAFASNLGNLMISEDNRFLYAIDNGIGDGRISSLTEAEESESQIKYLTFLQAEVNSEDFDKKIADRLISCIKESLQESDSSDQSLIKKIENELSTKGEEKQITLWVSNGIKSMETALIETVIPSWDKENFKDSLNPGLRNKIQDRLDVLKNKKNQPLPT